MYKKELKYIIEVNEGIYLTKPGFGQGYYFTKDIEKAKKITDLDVVKALVKQCGGKVLYYTITHEVK